MVIPQSKNFRAACVFLLVFAVFLPWLPSTVQYGDSGELVANAYSLRLSHPPGFPLYHWIFHFFLKIPTGLTLYAQAALLNAGLMAAALALVVYRLPWAPAILLALLLAFTEAILRQALLPDVFALHALLCVLAYRLASSQTMPDSKRWPAFCAVMALAGANHPTAIFLLPLLWGFRDMDDKRIFPGLGLAFALFALLYGSLSFFDQNASYAWKLAPGFRGLLGHILRHEYGSFHLSPHAEPVNLPGNFQNLLEAIYPLLIAIVALNAPRGLPWRRVRKKPALWMAATVLFGYVIGFYAMAGIPLHGFGAFVLERFHLMPALFAGLVLAEFLEYTHAPIALVSVALLTLVAGADSLPKNQWQRTTVLEDSLLYLRKEADASKASCNVLWGGDDSFWNGLNYLDTAFPEEGNHITVATGLLTLPLYRANLAARGLLVGNPKSEAVYDVNQDFLVPVLERCTVFTTDARVDTSLYHVTFLPLGRRLDRGSGFSAEPERWETLTFRSTPAWGDGSFSLDKAVFAHYAELPLFLGIMAVKKGNLAEAESWFGKGLMRAPFVVQSLENICITLHREGKPGPAAACDQDLARMKDHEARYL